MKLVLYYSLHSFYNAVRKLFKTWVLAFILVCALLGGAIGLGAAKLSEAAEEGKTEEELLAEELEAEEPTALELAGLEKDTAAEAVVGVLLLALLAFEALSADQNGSKIFLPADVNLLFPSPMKPHKVLLFRLAAQMGTALLASIYLIFQIPNLVINVGLGLWPSLSLLVVWFFALALGKLLQVILYLYGTEHPGFKRNLQTIVYSLLGALALGFFLFFKRSGESAFIALVRFFSAPITNFVPVWGWCKGIFAFAARGSIPGVCLFALACAGAMFGAFFLTGHMKADFYEDAMAKSEETAELMALQQSERAGGFTKRKKDRAESLRRDELRHGRGANVYFFKTMYNRFRFAHFGFLTKTMETYLVAGIGSALICRFWLLKEYLFIPALALSVLAFYRTLGNPLEKDTALEYFRLIPESTHKKLLWSLLGGTADCLLDVLPGLLCAALILHGSILELLGWLVFIATMDFYATAVGCFISLSVNTSAGKMAKQFVQILFIYFGILPDVAIIAVGFVLDNAAFCIFLAALVNAILGTVFFLLTPLFIDQKDGKLAPISVPAPAADRAQAKRVFSRLGLATAVVLAATTLLQLLFSQLLLRSFPAGDIPSWMQWVLTFAPLYLVGFPLGILIARRVPAVRAEKSCLSPGKFVRAVLISIFLMYTGSILGNLVNSLFSFLSPQGVENPLLNYAFSDRYWFKAIFLAVLAPIMEEFFFRRILIDRLRPYGERAAIFMSAACFALSHGNFSQLFYAFFVGLVLGYLYLRTGRLRGCTALHMLINLLGSVVAPWFVMRLDPDTLLLFEEDAFFVYPEFAAYVIFLLVLFLLWLAGLVTFFLTRRSLRFEPAPAELPRKGSFALRYCNPGMLLLIAECAAFLALSFLGIF